MAALRKDGYNVSNSSSPDGSPRRSALWAQVGPGLGSPDLEKWHEALSVFKALHSEEICRFDSQFALKHVGAAIAVARGATEAASTFGVELRQVSRWVAKLRQLHEKRPNLLQFEDASQRLLFAMPSASRPPRSHAGPEVDPELAHNEKKNRDTAAHAKRREDSVKRTHENETQKKRREKSKNDYGYRGN
ncbi:hypothetical protein T492DRAFT_1114708 [Pavlovales sp. CCMP2436]|nr:hypothetical protein T492DRAFT_1114708 [Pavlovales sp. CCMP2436]